MKTFPIILLHRLSAEYGEDLDEDICAGAALQDFASQYPMSSGIFSKSKTIIKPYELFGLLFSFADYKAIHGALMSQSQVIYADSNMKQCIAKFEKSLNKMYDPGQCLNVDNMFEKDIDAAEFEREMAMGGSPREIQKRMMKKMMDRMMAKKPTKQQHEEDQEKKKKLYLNQQLEIVMEEKGIVESKEIDWETVYTRENGRVLVNELRESMKVCVEAFIEERNKNISEMLMNCDGAEREAMMMGWR